MSAQIPTWTRDYYAPAGGDPFLFYVVYGAADLSFQLNGSAYRCGGIPEGIDVWGYTRGGDDEVFRSFIGGPIGKLFQADRPALYEAVEGAPGCIVIRGSVPDPSTLDYLRDVIGFVAYALDNGGVA